MRRLIQRTMATVFSRWAGETPIQTIFKHKPKPLHLQNKANPLFIYYPTEPVFLSTPPCQYPNKYPFPKYSEFPLSVQLDGGNILNPKLFMLHSSQQSKHNLLYMYIA